jgi:precorrin-6B methylase 2
MTLRALVAEFELELNSCLLWDILAGAAVRIELLFGSELCRAFLIERRAEVLKLHYRKIDRLKARMAVRARSTPEFLFDAILAIFLFAATGAFQQLVVYLEAEAALVVLFLIFVFYVMPREHRLVRSFIFITKLIRIG